VELSRSKTPDKDCCRTALVQETAVGQCAFRYA
jgi:hypothetical protein